MKPVFAVLLFAGLSLAIGLIAWQGFGEVTGVLAQGGWRLLWLPPCYLIYFLADTLAWKCLLAPASGRVAFLYFSNLIGGAVNSLLPVGQVGGDAVRARILIRSGIQAPESVASIIVEKTLQAATIVFFALIGLCLLVLKVGDVPVSKGVLVFALLLTAGIFIFYRLQHNGIFSFIVRFFKTDLPAGQPAPLVVGAAAVDAAVLALYKAPWPLLKSLLWLVIFRLAMAGEVYMALHFLGHPVGIIDSIILQSLGQAARAAAFLVPGALGIQEGGFLVVGLALGMGAEMGLALSLAKRVRELLIGLPGLMVWHISETRYWKQGWDERGSS